MKIKPKKTVARTFLVLCILCLITCTIDHGLLPINSMIGGKLYITGQAPPNTDELRVGVIKNFPPESITEIMFSNQLSYNRDTVEYEIFLPPGTYEVVAVIWKENDQSYNISDIVGVYGGGFIGDLLIPSFLPVTIADENTALHNTNIDVNLNRVNRDAVITGTVQFQGEWPSNTGLIAVGAFNQPPQPGNFVDYYFKSIYIDYTLSQFTSQSSYRLRVKGDEQIRYISALWIDDSYSLGSVRDIGFYPDPANPDQPGIVTVPNEGMLTDLDFTVDFSTF